VGVFSVFHVISEHVGARHNGLVHVWLPLAMFLLDYYQVR